MFWSFWRTSEERWLIPSNIWSQYSSMGLMRLWYRNEAVVGLMTLLIRLRTLTFPIVLDFLYVTQQTWVESPGLVPDILFVQDIKIICCVWHGWKMVIWPNISSIKEIIMIISMCHCTRQAYQKRTWLHCFVTIVVWFQRSSNNANMLDIAKKPTPFCSVPSFYQADFHIKYH